MIAGIEKRKYYFYYIEEMVLDKFNIKDEAELSKLNEFLKEEYSKAQKMF